MQYWLVSQRDSWPHERDLAILWSPLLGKNGRKVVAYERISAAQVGDVFFHYGNGHFRAVSRVVTAAVEAARPYDDPEPGQIVRVDIREFSSPISYREVPREMRFRMTGNGLPFVSGTGPKAGQVHQQYCAVVPTELAEWLLQRSGSAAPAAVQPGSPLTRTRPDFIFEPGPDGHSIGVHRPEQQALRRHLLDGSGEASCWYCGRTLPAVLLRLAHIKPRALAGTEERTDQHVASLACTLGCDALFELGLVVVDETGTIVRGRSTSLTDDLSAALDMLDGRSVQQFSESNADYFAFHQNHHLGKA